MRMMMMRRRRGFAAKSNGTYSSKARAGTRRRSAKLTALGPLVLARCLRLEEKKRAGKETRRTGRERTEVEKYQGHTPPWEKAEALPVP